MPAWLGRSRFPPVGRLGLSGLGSAAVTSAVCPSALPTDSSAKLAMELGRARSGLETSLRCALGALTVSRGWARSLVGPWWGLSLRFVNALTSSLVQQTQGGGETADVLPKNLVNGTVQKCNTVTQKNCEWPILIYNQTQSHW